MRRGAKADLWDAKRWATRPNTPDQKSEAYFYVGYEYFLQGDKRKAREYFQKTLDANVADSDEYLVARARLAQLSPK